MRQVFASRVTALAFCSLLVGGLACSSGSSGGGGTGGVSGTGGTGGSGTGGVGTGGAGTGGAGTGGAQTDAGGDTSDAKTDAPSDTGGGDVATGPFTLKSSTLVMMGANLAFPASASAPMNQSPELSWTNPPAGTMSFALTIYDLGMQNTHFVLSNISADTTMLPANLPRGAMPTIPAGATWKSAFGGTPGYEGPGAGPSTYEIELWALNVAKLPANIASQSLNMMHSTGLNTVKIASVKLTVKGQRNGF